MSINHLLKVVQDSLQYEKDALAKLPTLAAISVPLELLGIKSANEMLAIGAIQLENDFVKARQYFYKVTQMRMKYHQSQDYDISFFSIATNICYAVLSDHTPTKRFYQSLEEPKYQDVVPCFSRCVQATMAHDDETLAQELTLLEKRVRKKNWEKEYLGSAIAFKGLLQHDQTLVEKGIQKMLEGHLNLYADNFSFKHFFSIEATTLAKLAWQRALWVDIKSPLIPQALLVTQELDHYPNYDFFH